MLAVKQKSIIENTDWEFVNDNTNYGTHNFHRYSSKYIPQIVTNLLNIFSKEGDTVLDVFAGSGTTLIESMSLGRKSIGVDMNPVAYLITKAKTTKIPEHLLNRDLPEIVQKLRNDIDLFRFNNSLYESQLDFGYSVDRVSSKKILEYKRVDFKYIDAWFQPQVKEELSIICEHIRGIKDIKLRNFFICAFSAIIRTVSNANSGYGNLMVDKKKRKINNTFEIFERHLFKMTKGLREFQESLPTGGGSKIYLADSRKLDFIEKSSIDLIVTHPPYIGAVPYAEYLKLSLNWLRESFPEIAHNNFSKYLTPKELDKSIIGGRRRDKNVVAKFDEGMKAVFREMFRVLKKSKFCCIVIGNPTVFGEKIRLNKILVDFGKNAGFSFIQEIIRGKYRTTMGKMKEEYILIFKK